MKNIAVGGIYFGLCNFRLTSFRSNASGSKLPPDPFCEVIVLGMGRVGNRFEKMLVATDASYIFRWTGASSGQAQGIQDALFSRNRPLHHEDMLPVISKIVVVCELLARMRRYITQHIRALVFRFRRTWLVLFRYAVTRAADYKPVDVGIFPAHHALQDSVKSRERGIAHDLHAPPYERLRATERHLNLIDLERFFHGSTLIHPKL